MKKTSFLLFYLLLFLKLHAQSTNNNEQWRGPQTLQTLYAAPVSLIPFPQKVKWTREKWALSSTVIIVAAENKRDITANAIRSLKEILATNSINTNLKAAEKVGKNLSNTIHFIHENNLSLKDEGYVLQISTSGIQIKARDETGFYYAVQTLRQIIAQKNVSKQLPGCNISDWPAFGLRGFMHDNGRNFQSIEMLKAQLEKLSWYKFNTFHWHLTDNPAWRPQSNIYPQLNHPKNRKAGRDPDSTYSFNDIRELIRYARERSITIIPELDMPGHSKYFEPTFGFKMESEQGMQVLEKLIDEFCKEIPFSDCPIIHLGSDEVRIPNPVEFIGRMTARVKANGRRVMVWNPGLPPNPGTIEQVWMDDATKGERRKNSNPYVDSYGGYLNYFDAFTLIQRYFFQQICNQPEGDSLALGGIVCCWPDARVDDKEKIALHNAVWPGAITYSEAVWCGRPQYNQTYMNVLPPVGSTANKYFKEFEIRLSKQRKLFFTKEYFPYAAFGSVEWMMTGPFHRDINEAIDKDFLQEGVLAKLPDSIPVKKVTGGILRFAELMNGKKLANPAMETVYLTAYIFSNKAKQIHAITGFETAARSNRRSAGIPLNGKWDANGGAIIINDKELPGPVWNNPGGNRYLQATWEQPPNEIPFTDEEFYWSRLPAAIQLQKGWNKIVVRAPRAYRDQNWIFVFVPVRKDANGYWIEDSSVHIKATKNR
ncbi:MAG TPA: beta-N-acetylhexosaminidase [Chitinophagaceae bacterium]